MVNAAAESFLWCLFRLGCLGGDSKQAIEWAASFYDRGIVVSAKLETLIVEYWTSGDRAVLLSLAQLALEGFCLNVEHRTRLTAYLFTNGEIDATRACAFLGFDGVNVDDLKPSVRRVADAHWLVRHDSAAGVMEPDDDTLLSEALRALAVEGTTNNE